MSTAVYPNTGFTPNAHACAFFSALPRAVGDLRQQGRLKPRDVDVLRELLDHKNSRTTQVDPRQETLAARLGCGLDTIQRSLARLVQAGLITKIRLRDARGRLGRCVYDLALTLALMPHQAAKLRRGEWGQPGAVNRPAADANPVAATSLTTPQKCGLSEAEKGCSVEADTTAPPQASPTAPAVVLLKAQGIQEAVARRLAAVHGEARCRAVAEAAAQVKRFRHSKAAWIISALRHQWNVTPPAEARPRSQWPYRPPQDPAAPAVGAAGATRDPLDTLSPTAYDALEARARALLWPETLPAWRETLLMGRNKATVRTRMRTLLVNDAQAAPTPAGTF